MNATSPARHTSTVAATLIFLVPTLLAALPAAEASTPAPTSVTAVTGPGPGVITLSWSPPSGGGSITGYRVYRGESAQTLQPVDVSAGTRTYEDHCVGDGRTWYYSVAALDSSGEGTPSDVINAISGIPPAVGDAVAIMGARLPTAHSGSSAVWTGVDALIFGGRRVSDILRFNPAQDCVTTLPAQLPTVAEGTSALWNQGNARIFGGENGGVISSGIVTYDPSTGTVSTLPTLLPSPRHGTTAVLAGSTYVIGGVESGGDTDEIVDGSTGDVVAHLPDTRSFAAAVWTGEQVFILGGSQDGLEWPDIYVFDPQTGYADWASAYLAHDGIQGAGVAWDGQYAYLAGGSSYTAGFLDEIQRFDPTQADNSEVVPTLGVHLPYPVAFPSSVWDGRHLYLFGGYDGTDDLDTVIRFTPSLPSERAAPQNLAAVRGPTAGKITIAWQPPADTNGLTGYRVYRGPMTALEIRHADVGTTPSFTDSGLAAGSNWCYKVTALYGSVESRISNGVCAKAPTLPGLPIITQAAPGTSLGEIRVQWTAPADTGGIPLSGYRVYRDEIAVASPTASPFVDSNVAAWTSHAYAVAAVNDVGEGPKSATLNAYPASTPSMPRSLSVSSIGSGKLQLYWVAPVTNGGSTITNYRIYRTAPGGTERWIDEIGPVNYYTDSFLAEGTYTYRVTGVNGFGEGQSPTDLLASALTLPSRPDVLATFGPCAGQVTLQWNVEDDGGTPIIDFKIFRSLVASSQGTLIQTVPGSNSMYTDSPGASNVNYYYLVEGRNSKGPSISYEDTVFVPPGGCVGGAPTPVPNPFPPGDPTEWCGITDQADLDGDLKPDCSDPDDDNDRLEDAFEEKLELDPRDPDTDDDGKDDRTDPVPTEPGFAVAFEVSKVCVDVLTDGYDPYANIEPADPFLAPEAAVRIHSFQGSEFGKIRVKMLQSGNDLHYHNIQCTDAFDNQLPKDVRTVVELPEITLSAWDSFNDLSIPQINFHFPLIDHDTSNCLYLNNGHGCAENVHGNEVLGYPDAGNVIQLLSMVNGESSGTPSGSLNTNSLGLTAEMSLNGKLRVYFRARLNASGCDILTATLGRGVSSSDPTDLVTIPDFQELERNVALGDICSRL